MRRQGPASEMSSGTEKGYQILHSTHLRAWSARNLGSAPCCTESSAFFFPCIFLLLFFLLNTHWSRGRKPVICSQWMCWLPSCGVACVVSDSVNICVQSRKSSRGRSEWSHPTALPSQSGKAQGRDFSPGQPWGELESLVAEGAEGCVGVPAVVCSQCSLCSRSIFWEVGPLSGSRQRNTDGSD